MSMISYDETKDFLTKVAFDDVKDLHGALSEFNFVSLVYLPEEYPAILYLVIIDKPGPNKNILLERTLQNLKSLVQ